MQTEVYGALVPRGMHSFSTPQTWVYAWVYARLKPGFDVFYFLSLEHANKHLHWH